MDFGEAFAAVFCFTIIFICVTFIGWNVWEGIFWVFEHLRWVEVGG